MKAFTYSTRAATFWGGLVDPEATLRLLNGATTDVVKADGAEPSFRYQPRG